MPLDVNAKATQLERLTGYSFTNKLLAAEAVQMAAPRIDVIHGSLRGLPNNKRLSILGDAVLTKVLCGLWFRAFDNRGEHRPAPTLLAILLTSQATSSIQATGLRCATIY